MANELYSRQESFGLAGPYLSVAIIGCGGVGSWAALAIALGGCAQMLLFDGDIVSLHNLNRLPLEASCIGESKSLALAGLLGKLRPEGEFSARGMFEPKLHTDLLQSVNWVVCCTDSLKSRLTVRAACGPFQNYLEIGADGERWTLSPEPPEFATELESDPGYAIVPVHVGPCMMAGAAAAYYVLHNVRPEYSHIGEWRVWQNARRAGLELSNLAEFEPTVEDLSYPEAIQAEPTNEAIPLLEESDEQTE